jgi:hypothetical protein
MPNPQAGGPPRVDCPRLFIQCIRSYPPYLEAVSTIRNPRTLHAEVTGTHPTWCCVPLCVHWVIGSHVCNILHQLLRLYDIADVIIEDVREFSWRSTGGTETERPQHTECSNSTEKMIKDHN